MLVPETEEQKPQSADMTIESLDENQKQEIVKKLLSIWDKGYEARNTARTRRSWVVRAYNCIHDSKYVAYARSIKGRLGFLPWVYIAIEIGVNRLINVLLPNDEDTFTFEPKTPDDKEGCKIIEQYQKSIFQFIDFKSKFKLAIKQCVFGEAVLKVFWDKRETLVTEMGVEQVEREVVDELGNVSIELVNQRVGVKKPKTIANNFDFSLINPDDFIIYPIHGDESKASKGFRTWMTKEELEQQEAQGLFYGIEAITSKNTHDNDSPDNNRTEKLGLEVIEIWVNSMSCGGTSYTDFVAAIVDRKHLVRFEPNPLDYGLKPFIYCPLINDVTDEGGVLLTGHGLCQRALEIQRQANAVFNQMLNEAALKLSGWYKYIDDGVTDPSNIIAYPGNIVKVGDMGSIEEMQVDMSKLSFGMNELQYLQSQFDQATGIPQFYKGVAQFEGDSTATESRLKAEGSDTTFRAYAEQINQKLLVPLVKLAYVYTRQQAMNDVSVLHDIARRTQVLKQEVQDPNSGEMIMKETSVEEAAYAMPNLPSLDTVDIKVVAFENVLNSSEKANAQEQFMNFTKGMIDTINPDIRFAIKPLDTLSNQARNLRIEGDIIRTEDEMKEAKAVDTQMQMQEAQLKANFEMQMQMQAAQAGMITGEQP